VWESAEPSRGKDAQQQREYWRAHINVSAFGAKRLLEVDGNSTWLRGANVVGGSKWGCKSPLFYIDIMRYSHCINIGTKHGAHAEFRLVLSLESEIHEHEARVNLSSN
jgi:hypothetical protein